MTRRVGKQGKTVLLVDDDDDVRDVMAEILELDGYVVHACDGLPAVEAFIARGIRPDLLLTDLVLPGGSGLSVASSVRARDHDIAVLFVSGFAQPVFSGDQSVEHLLHKPFTSQALLRKVREILDRG